MKKIRKEMESKEKGKPKIYEEDWKKSEIRDRNLFIKCPPR